MKNRSLLLSLLALVIAAFSLQAQDEPVDPFEKPKVNEAQKAPTPAPATKDGKKTDPFAEPALGQRAPTAEALEPDLQIVLAVEYVEVPKIAAEKLLRETANGDEQRKQIQGWIEKGDAISLDSTMIVARPGQRAKIESVREVRFPTERVEVPAAPKMPLFPTGFEVRNAGLTFEVDPVLNADLSTMNLNYALEQVAFVNRSQHPDAVDSGPIQHGDVVEAGFEVRDTVNQINALEIGRRWMIGTFEPFVAEKRDSRILMAFLRWDLQEAWPPKDQSKVKKRREARFRFEWVEVPADPWHEIFHNNELGVVAGESWKIIDQWIKDGRAATLKTIELSAISGQRSRSQSMKTTKYPHDFSLPQVEGGPSEFAGYEERKVGTIVEVDPVIGLSGVVDLNMAPEVVSHHGEFVFYRRQQGDKWVPTVELPNFYSMKISTQITLGENAHLLTAVHTPPNGDGNPDYSRKVLLFIHNDTYRD